MSTLDDYAKAVRSLDNAKKQKKEHPKGWEPGVVLNGGKSFVSSGPVKSKKEAQKKWDQYIELLGFDPSEFEIMEPVHVRTWTTQTAEGVQQMFYYKADIRSKRHIENDKDYDKLVAEIKKVKKPARKVKTKENGSMVVCLSDWQMGKRDGDGTEGIIKRVTQMIPDVIDRAKELRKAGNPINKLYVFGLGDIVEGCGEHYAMQNFSVEIDQRRQEMVARRLIVEALKKWSPHFDKVIVAAIPGNHGENRKNGKAFTTFGDNIDVSVFDQAAEILGENKAFDHVSFVIPNNELWLTLDIDGVILGIAHGHQFRTGGRYSHQKAVAWLSGQAFGKTDMGDVDILLSGHFHHLFVINEGQRTLMQAPSVDGGSEWFENISGKNSFSGTLTFTIKNKENKLPWDNLQVL
jgi:predicted phosphodiesterase